MSTPPSANQPAANQPAANQPDRGFSLIEVTIAMVVLGLLMAATLQVYNLYATRQITSITSAHITTIQAALQKYALRNGRYPRPADPSQASGSAGFGQEHPLAGPYSCAPPSAVAVCRTHVGTRDTPDAGGTPDRVLIGDVPFAVLGLPQQFILDGWGNKYTYAVSEHLTDKIVTSFSGFHDDWGVVRILDNSGADTTGTIPTGNAHFIIVSHGRDGRGAITLNGNRPVPCGISYADSENCDKDGVFNDNFKVLNGRNARYEVTPDTPAAAHYDDYIGYSVTTTGNVWTRTANNPHIYSRNSLFTRIGPGGTLTPCSDSVVGTSGSSDPNCPDVPDVKVDVVGQVAANTLETRRLCPFGGCEATSATGGLAPPAWANGSGADLNSRYKYFTPAVIGGVPSTPEKDGGGINCGDKGVKGVYYADEDCANNFPSPAFLGSVTCGIGTGGSKIVGGVLVCTTP